jgi:hypothetical protein
VVFRRAAEAVAGLLEGLVVCCVFRCSFLSEEDPVNEVCDQECDEQ